jgi:hypothetical protein
MFGKKEKQNVHEGPYPIRGSLSRIIGKEWEKIPQRGDHWAEYLAVSRPRPGNQEQVDIRIFYEWCAAQKRIEVKDFSSLVKHPDLVLMEGWYDQKSKKGSIKAKPV